ncbi:MAG: nuclease (SNase domain protein) [Vampirovibrio sp.]|jgi:micrococcal nuclease|nr:nuclease (SNase domain protein) [Vampirovibrio sp.]
MRINEKLIGGLLIVAGFGGLLASYFQDESTSKPVSTELTQSLQTPEAQAEAQTKAAGQRTACTVLTVYDGDTLGCDMNEDGEIQRPREEVRLLGIDSPEMHYSRKNPTYGTAHPTDEPFARQASQFLQRQVQGKTVWLEFDLRRHDKYGRSLGHVFAKRGDTLSLNQQELAQGYATTLFIGKNRLYEDEYMNAESKARNAKRGLWGRAD